MIYWGYVQDGVRNPCLPLMIRTEDPRSGFRQRAVEIQRISGGWSRLLQAEARLLKEGGKTAGFDGRRDNVSYVFLLVLRHGFSPSVTFGDSPLVRGGHGTA